MTINEYTKLNMSEKSKYINNYINDDFFCIEDGNNIPVVIHKPTNLRFRFIPGGEGNKGISDLEYSLIKKINHNSIDSIDEILMHFMPRHKITVNDFLVSEYPIPWQFVSMYFPEYKNNKGAAWLCKSMADRLCSMLSFRLISDDEWEYIARCGKRQLFPFGDFIPKNEKELEKWMVLDYDRSKMICTELGVYGLFYGEWTGTYYTNSYNIDDSGISHNEFCIRGGASQFYPWQDCGEWLQCICSYRMPSSGLFDDESCAFRFVYDL